jgi:putative hydrolase of HD superfamily
MNDINRLREIYGLKSVYRNTTVGERKESSAEHSWSCLLLADFLLDYVNEKIDRLRVYELLMYHDLVEVYAGDVVFHPKNIIDKEQKKQVEDSSALLLKNRLPSSMGSRYLELYFEYEERKSYEAKFAKVVDILDAMIHQLDNKDDWVDWTRDFLIKHKLEYFRDFPEIEKLFFDILEYLEEKEYI